MKQNSLQNMLLAGAGMHIVTGTSKTTDSTESVSSAGNPKMHQEEKYKSLVRAFHRNGEILLTSTDSCIAHLERPNWLTLELLQYSDLKCTSLYQESEEQQVL
jgi:hypothetical protein